MNASVYWVSMNLGLHDDNRVKTGMKHQGFNYLNTWDSCYPTSQNVLNINVKVLLVKLPLIPLELFCNFWVDVQSGQKLPATNMKQSFVIFGIGEDLIYQIFLCRFKSLNNRSQFGLEQFLNNIFRDIANF